MARGRFGRGDVGGVAVELVAFDEDEKGHRVRTEGRGGGAGKAFNAVELADGRADGGRGGNGGSAGTTGIVGDEAGWVKIELVATETGADTGSGSDSGTVGLAV